ncbi:DNA internalization-related competence protein ComEC/Rec2 [Stutzerimonas azotifigens]|uniref:DNA internalization-related competence protein ComEC/Rec2 n=1 Tax=Stutzerimonas azotifigens TaxID=291995 RepID=UPI0004841847|nr:DNA internalization-related competence protein ComEC/Rec2 [Stutzerimonas azotifigens]
MRAGMLALAGGLVLPRFLPTLPPLWLVLGLAVLGLACAASRYRSAGLLLLGFGWACVNAQWALDGRLAPALDGRTFWLEGRVVGLPDRREGVTRFEMTAIESRHDGLPDRLRLAWYGGPDMRAGERWRVAARLKRPHGLVNPQGFDYEAWLLAGGFGATGTVKAGERLEAAKGAGGWRDGLRTRLLGVEAAGRQGALAALVVGDASGLSSADWRALQATGTVHLMVISGQHVGMLAGLLYGLVAVLARGGLWPRRLPWLPSACALALSGALAYGWLAGFEVPVRRACLMVAVVLLWRLRFRHLGVWLPLLVALNGVLLLDPLASLQPGFWLSFGAVALLALVFSGRLGAWRWWQALGRAQWAAALGLLPLMLALGLPVSLSGPLANLVAVPWVSLLVVPAALLGALLLPVPLLGAGLLWGAGLLLSVLFDLLALVAQWQPAWLPPTLGPVAWGLLALGVFLLLLPAGLPGRAFGAVLALPFLFPGVELPDEGQARVWVLDVGQGLSVLVQTQGHALLYDAAPRYGDFDLGERVVVPVLRGLGVSRLDVMLLSHADSDHAGGARAVADALPVLRTVSGEPARLPAALAAEDCRRGEQWSWDGVHFRLWKLERAATGNAASCVLMVEAAGERLLLTGDIDAATEGALVEEGWPIAADWLLVPHHGSRSSTSARFLDAVGPRDALVSRGMHNAFGHPHPLVVERLRSAGVRVHDTALDGALQLFLGERKPLRRQRDERRFWREK